MVFKAFKIWYSEGTYTGYSYADWKKAPKNDVQVVMVYHKDNTRRIMVGNDIYTMTEDGDFNQFDIGEDRAGYRLYGAWTSTENMDRLHHNAMEDQGEWIRKSRKTANKTKGEDGAPPKREKR